MVYEILRVIDHPILKGTLLILMVFLLLHRNSREAYIGDRAVILITVLTVLIYKWYPLLYNGWYGEDESQAYSSALVLLKDDPVLFRGADYFTAGFLTILNTLILNLFYDGPSYFLARGSMLISTLLILILLFNTSKNFFRDRRIAYFSYFLVLLWVGTNRIGDFSWFNNEVTSILFLTGGMYFLSVNYASERHSNMADFWAVFLCSLAIYAKLQAVLIAFFICGWVLIQKSQHEKVNLIYLIKLIIAGTIFSVTLLIYFWHFDMLDDVKFFMIETNLSYGNSQTGILNRIFNYFFTPSSSGSYHSLFKVLFLLVVVLVFVRLLIKKRFELRVAVFLTLSFITIYTVSITGNHFGHYLSYIFVFLFLGLGLILEEATNYRKWLFWPSLLVLIGLFSEAIYYHNQRYSPQIAEIKGKEIVEPIKSEISKFLSDFADDKNLKSPKLVIFGWRNELHIETGFLQGTRYNVPERMLGYQANNPAVLDKARRIYLDDLRKNRPEFFLVSLNKERSVHDMTLKALKSLPQVYGYFTREYSFLTSKEDFQIFVRKDILTDE